jgi:hypothetical protein
MNFDKQFSDKPPAPDHKPGANPPRRRFRSDRRRDRNPPGEGNAPGEAREQPSVHPKALDKAQQERRERRRRRRLKAKQRGADETRPEMMAPDPELDLPPKPVFVYTHVIRPAVRDSYEFRSEHFSKVTRRLEDFRIDLSPLFRSEEEAAKLVQEEIVEGLAEELTGDLDDDLEDDDLEDDELEDDGPAMLEAYAPRAAPDEDGDDEYAEEDYLEDDDPGDDEETDE